MDRTQPLNPLYLASWTPDTGTHELPAIHRGLPVGDLPTTELPFWMPRPTVPTRVERPNRLRRLTRSPLAVHLRASARSAFWPCAIGAGVIVALLIIAHLQGLAPTPAIR